MKTFLRTSRVLFPIVASFVTIGVAGGLLAQDDRRIIGYFPAWGVYARDYHVPDIPAEKLTHINYAFANVINGECVLGDVHADTQRMYPGDVWGQPLAGSFHQLQLLKANHPHLKTLISVGGWTWSGGFPEADAWEKIEDPTQSHSRCRSAGPALAGI